MNSLKYQLYNTFLPASTRHTGCTLNKDQRDFHTKYKIRLQIMSKPLFCSGSMFVFDHADTPGIKGTWARTRTPARAEDTRGTRGGGEG